MKRTHFLIMLPTLLSLSACQDHVQPTTSSITGNWAGTFETLQTGQCGWSGAASIPATATWQVVNNTVSGTVNRQFGQFSSPAQFTGIINGGTVSVSETNNANCFGTSRTYVSRYNGTLSGNTLTLVSSDTLCPVQGCLFQRTLRLTRQ